MIAKFEKNLFFFYIFVLNKKKFYNSKSKFTNFH